MGEKFKNGFSKINNNINKLNKITLLLLVVAYAAVLTGLYALVNQTRSYITIPQYSHEYFNEEINPQISIIALRTFDDDDNMTLKYNVSVSIYGRISATSTADPQYSISNFKMSAATVENITSSKVNSMYYFTEQNTYTTPTVHTYTVDNSKVAQNPSTFYTMLQYKKGTKNQIATFKEDVMLQPSNKDIEALDASYVLNKDTNATSIDFADSKGTKLGNLQVIASDNTANNAYTSGVKITMSELTYQTRHHIDMQTWIVTSSNEYLPFIGVYSYSSQKSNYVQSGRSIAKQLKPKYICAKLVYYFSETEYKEYYFKQDITKLGSSFSSTPNVGEDVPENINNKPYLYIIGGTLAGVVGIGLCAAGVYFFSIKGKANKKEESASEEANESNVKKE